MAITETANVAQKPEAKKANAPKVHQPKAATVALRTPIAEGATAKREFTTDATAKRVVSTFSFKLSDKATERYQVESTFDFSDCSQEEILELAASSVRISVQGKLRAMGQGALRTDAYATVNVKKEIVETQRTALDDVEKVSRALNKLSAAEKARIMAQLAAK